MARLPTLQFRHFCGRCYSWLYCRSASVIPAYLIARKKEYGAGAEKSRDSVWKAFKDTFWGLMVPVIKLGGLYGGIFSPTEAAVAAVFYSLLLGFDIYRSLPLKITYEILVDASEASAVVILIGALAGDHCIPLAVADPFCNSAAVGYS